MNQYEAMFLFDPTFGSSFEDCEAEIRRLMDRAQAEIIFCRKWDERRLAYKIRGRKRGVYVLVYFKAPPEKIGPLQRDAQISESVLRLLVLRAEGVTPEMMERAAAARGTESTPGAADREAAGGGEKASEEEKKAGEEAEQTDKVALATKPDDAGGPQPRTAGQTESVDAGPD